MQERGLPIAGASGWCRGASGELVTPEKIILSAHQGADNTVECKLFIPETKTCKQGHLPCVWTVFEASKQPRNPELRCETAAGELIYNRNSGEVVKSPLLETGHDPIKMTAAEGTIMEELLQYPGWVVSRDQLLERLAASRRKSAEAQTIAVHMIRVRRKLGQSKGDTKNIIETITGRGYRLSVNRRM